MCQSSLFHADGDAKQRKIQKRLQTIKREERAIKAALESLDHQGDSEDELGEPGHSESAKPPPDAQQEKQQQLQRATLTNRLQGLRAKRDQLKVDILPKPPEHHYRTCRVCCPQQFFGSLHG